MMLRSLWLSAAVCLVIAVASNSRLEAQSAGSSVESALATIFSPRRAPGAKTMGLVQRNFLDLVEVTQARLQVALVVDGTESMGGELEGIRRALSQMVEDLSRYKDQVSFQLVVFRDEGAPSGAVTFPLSVSGRGFTTDSQLLASAIEQIQAETGAPYYPELIDAGIHAALTELAWSQDQDTSRWLLVFSDAPPFEEGFQEEPNKAARRFATAQLIATANRQAISVNCVLCASRPEDQAVHEEVLAKTREFMSRLTTETGGLMLDLSYQDIRGALDKAAQSPRVSYQKIGEFTRQDIDRERQRVEEQKTLLAQSGRSRIAVLPHMPLEELAFDPSLEPVQVAAELRHRLRGIPGAEVKSPLAIERHAAILKARGVRGDELLQMLASALNVDYVVWGNVTRDQGNLEIRSAIYDRVTGNQIVADLVRTNEQLPVTDVTARLVDSLRTKVVDDNRDIRLVAALRQVTPGSPADARLISPVAQTAPARTNLLAGFELLEKALAFPAGDSQAETLLTEARDVLEKARDEDQQNPLAYLLLANCCFNQAQALLSSGQDAEASGHLEAFAQALSVAHRFRREAKFEYLRLEIEADYALLISKDYAAAAAAYEELARISPDTPLHTALRAHWMLAGIHSGDWGVADNSEGHVLINAAQAREHLIQILAHWPESSEAEFVRHNLRWDERAGENQFEYMPRVNESAAKGVIGT